MVQQALEIDGDVQPQIFVSYARQDAERVLSIDRLLEQEGTTVWRDQEQILGGQYYGEQIVHAIAHSRVVILMCSPLAFQSDNVHREVLLTWDHYHRRYIPVWLVHALGVIWYQFLMGDLASPAPTGRKWINALRGRGMSEPAVQLLSSCLESGPADRPADARTLAEQLKALPDSTLTKSAGSKPELSVVEAEPDQSAETSRPPLREDAPSHPGERTVKPARTQVRHPEILKSRDVLPVPGGQQDAEFRAVSEHFTKSRAFISSVAAGAIGLVGLLGVILYFAANHGPDRIAATDVKRPPGPQGGIRRAAPPSTRVARGSKPALPSTGDQSPAIQSSSQSLENLWAKHSVWKGHFAFEEGNKGRMEFYVQERAGRTFKGIHVGRTDNVAPNRGMVWVEGTVHEGVLYYHSQATDGQFNVRGTLNGDQLEIVCTTAGGAVANATLKKEAEKPESAQVVLSVFQKHDAEGWYTLNHDGSDNATRPVTVESNPKMGISWLVAYPTRNPKEFGWHAPPKYHGDHTEKYGRYLIYSLNTADVRRIPLADRYVRLSGSGMTLYLDGNHLQPPAGKMAWKTYAIRLATDVIQ